MVLPSTSLRLWFREFRATPALGLLAVSLAVSLAAGITTLALYGAVQWQALPFDRPDDLLSVRAETAEGRDRWWSRAELQALAEAPPPGIEHVAGFTVADYNLLAEPGRPPEALLGTLVSDDFFRVLGIGVLLGRLPLPDETADTGPRVVVLGHEVWQRRYGGDPAIVGRTVRLAAPEYLGEPDASYRVIGVLRPDTWLFWKRADLVLPLRTGVRAATPRDAHLIERMIARAAPGTRPTARLAAALLDRLPASRERVARVLVAPLAETLFRDLRPQLQLLLVVACLVLGLAAINMTIAVAAAMLARRQQNAVRIAVGATALRMARDAGTHTCLTAATAGILGLVLATWQLHTVAAAVPDRWLARIPGTDSAVRLSAPALVGLAATLAGLVAGVGAWTFHMTRRLASGSLTRALEPLDVPLQDRWRHVLVSIEVSLCTSVVIIAASLTLQLQRARSTDLGVSADRTVAAWINASVTQYPDARSRSLYFARILDRIGDAPGIEAVGAISLPFHLTWQTVPVRPGAATTAAPVHALDRRASANYAAVAGLRVLDGRWFDASDDASAAPVVVMSGALARALWPGQRAVGQTLAVGEADTAVVATVIGVVSDTRANAHADPSRTLYRPVAQAPPSWIYVTVKAAAGTQVWSAVTGAVWMLDPDQPVDGPWPIETWIADRSAGLSFLAATAIALAAIGALLAGMGVLGLTMHWVHASQREVGIRRALGADDRAILLWFGRRWMRVLAPAVVAGAVLQEPMLRVTVSAVEGVRPASLAEVFGGVLTILILGSMAAALGLLRLRNVDSRRLA